jgi:hypothetical protein
MEMEEEWRKKVADQEKENFERLKGFSPYLVDIVECFDEVTFFFFLLLFRMTSDIL